MPSNLNKEAVQVLEKLLDSVENESVQIESLTVNNNKHFADPYSRLTINVTATSKGSKSE